MIDLQALQALVAVQRTGSVAAAAAELGFTPSAVSQQIKKLERQSRTALLERNGRGVLVTERGRALVEHGGRILSELEEMESVLSAGEEPNGTFTVASFSTAARGLLVHVACRLAEEAPDMRLEVVAVDPAEAVGKVAHGDVDLAVIHDWNSVALEVPGNVALEPLCEDIADIIVPATHRLAGLDAIPRAELLPETWCSQPRGAICHEALLRLLAEEGATPRIAFIDPDFATHIEFVAQGLALAFVPRLGRGPIPDGVVARPLAGGQAHRSVSAAYRRTMSASPGVKLLVRLLQEAAEAAGR
ncbi:MULTISPECIES: LysR family transcriptional regulator [Arthrobacter]|uniref:LysR family transcriptional regulator n=2 Tax=Arthrobacter TaxID=1663 RepID=A0ABU9KJG9_9MICC|nr:LysR family transcriptional regulator [Arthrobacter sp. YJM1]MDP5226657.1 LysR family transcriptional regulator [Arthrobacter sp. YJM1]